MAFPACLDSLLSGDPTLFYSGRRHLGDLARQSDFPFARCSGLGRPASLDPRPAPELDLRRLLPFSHRSFRPAVLGAFALGFGYARRHSWSDRHFHTVWAPGALVRSRAQREWVRHAP